VRRDLPIPASPESKTTWPSPVFALDQLKVGRRAGKRRAAKFGERRLYRCVSENCVDDHREHVLFRVVRECDRDETNEGSSVKAPGLPASLLDQLRPGEIEPDGSDGLYDENVIDLDDEAAVGSGFRFMRSKVITLRPSMS
jgi:hypothetical protein